MPQIDTTAIGNRTQLLLHADDLGLNRAVTEGIVRGFEQGLLTSASLLANAPDAPRALDRWKQLDERRAAGDLPGAEARRALGDPLRPFDLGVHLNLTQGVPLTGAAYPLELLDSAGRFPGAGRLFWSLYRGRRSLRSRVKEELSRQVRFLLDRGLRPTHLNGHQYVEMMPVVAELIPELVRDFGIPAVRVACEPRLWRSTLAWRFSPQRWVLGHIKHFFGRRLARLLRAVPVGRPDAFFGTVHAGAIDLELIRVFLAPPLPSQTVEIVLHPAEIAERDAERSALGWHDPLAARRPGELELLVSAGLREYLTTGGYRLARMADLPPGVAEHRAG